MAANDSAIYTLRYNQLSDILEGATSAGNWVALTLLGAGITQLTGDVTAGPGSGSQVASISSTTVTGKLLTGYVSGPGVVAASDSILQAIQKLNGNVAAYLPLTGGTLTGPLIITPASSGTATLRINDQSGVQGLAFDTTHQKLLIGAVDVDTDSAFTIYKTLGSGNTLDGKVQNISTSGLSEWQAVNDNGGFMKIGIGGSTVSSAFASQPYLWGNNNGLMLLATGSTQQILFNFNAAASGSTKAIMDSTGVFTKYAGAATVGVGLSPTLAKVALTAQAANIGNTTLLAVPATGLYTVAVYAVTTTTDAGAGASTTVNVGWTDDSGAQTLPLGTFDLTASKSFMSAGPGAFQVTNGSNITYSVTGGGTYGAARYSLYITVQRIN